MKNIFASLFVAIASMGFVSSANATLKINMVMKSGGSISKPQITTQYGLPLSFSQKIQNSSDTLEMVAVPHSIPAQNSKSSKAVQLNFEISRLSGSQRTLISQPQIITLLDQKASLVMSSESGESYEFEIVASEI